jgi:hypothetical protein
MNAIKIQPPNQHPTESWELEFDTHLEAIGFFDDEDRGYKRKSSLGTASVAYCLFQPLG